MFDNINVAIMPYNLRNNGGCPHFELTSRNETAMRDIYDVWYFTKNNWDISTEILKIMADKTIQEHLADCIAIIENVKDNQILQGLGELLSEKEKMWVKTDLRKETAFFAQKLPVCAEGAMMGECGLCQTPSV